MTMIQSSENIFFNESFIPVGGKLTFCLVEAVCFFSAVRNHYRISFNKCLITGSGTNFLASTYDFFIYFSETPAVKNFYAYGKLFVEQVLYLGYFTRTFRENRLLYLRIFFNWQKLSLISLETNFLRHTLILLVETDFLASGNAFLSLSLIFLRTQ